MFKYLLLNKEGYCYGFSILNSPIEQEDMVLLDSEEDENSYLNRKYDTNGKVWLNEYKSNNIETDELLQSEIQAQILLNTEYLVSISQLNNA